MLYQVFGTIEHGYEVQIKILYFGHIVFYNKNLLVRVTLELTSN